MSQASGRIILVKPKT